jgi:hypothetical protein
MTTQAQGTSVLTQIVVEAPIERAFRVFTEDFGSFKPPEHNLLGAEIAETVFEPREGGQLYDRGVDGSECRWARVLAYEPPNRVVISWDINPRWQIETNLEKTRGRGPVRLRGARAYSGRGGAPQPRAPWRGLGGDARRGRLARRLAALPAEVRRATQALSAALCERPRSHPRALA